MFRPTHILFSESVDSLSANCNTWPLLLLHLHFQHHFYLLFQPFPPHLVLSNPLAPLLFTSPLCCVLAKVGHLWKIFFLFSHFRFTESMWQSREVVGGRKHHASTILVLCLKCTLGMDGSLENRKEAICLRTTLSLCHIWSGVDRVY